MTLLKVPIISSDHIQGVPEAPLILVEYGDYECPHCGHAYPILKRVQKHFGKRLAFVFRNFPLNEMHPHAEIAAETAEFAAAHGRFWEMHDAIYENQADLGQPFLLGLANTLKLPVAELRGAWNDQAYAPRVRKDFMGGVRSGVNGTPALFINGQRHDGSFEFEDLVAVMEGQLQRETTLTRKTK